VCGNGTERRTGPDRAGSADEIAIDATERAMHRGRTGSTVSRERACRRRMHGASVNAADTPGAKATAAHAHATAAHAHTTAAGMKAATTAVETAASATMEATAAAAMTTATAAMTGGRFGGRSGHGHSGQKREGKLGFHVTPVPESAPCGCSGGPWPKPKLRQSRSGFRFGQSHLRKVALRHAQAVPD
jgi:hypothetical protein